MKIPRHLISILLLTGGFYSCTYEKGDLIYPAPNPIDSMLIQVSYLNDIRPILMTYCFGTGPQRCHVTNTNQGANGDFTTYAGIKAKADNGSLEARVLNPLGGMPPSYTTGPIPVTEEDKLKIRYWIDAGAPNN